MSEDKAQDVKKSSTENDGLITFAVGSQIYVRNRFLGDWTSGFTVAEVLSHGYRIRRVSDGHEFPDVFSFHDVRLERRQHPLRGIGKSHVERRRQV